MYTFYKLKCAYFYLLYIDHIISSKISKRSNVKCIRLSFVELVYYLFSLVLFCNFLIIVTIEINAYLTKKIHISQSNNNDTTSFLPDKNYSRDKQYITIILLRGLSLFI